MSAEITDPNSALAAGLEEHAKWWTAAFAGFAVVILGYLPLTGLGGLPTWGKILVIVLTIAAFALAIGALFTISTVFSQPRSWADLTRVQQLRCSELGYNYQQIVKWEKSTATKADAARARSATLELLRREDVEANFEQIRVAIAVVAAGIVLCVLGAVSIGAFAVQSCSDSKGGAIGERCAMFDEASALPVSIVLLGDADKSPAGSKADIRGRLGGKSCSPPVRFDAWMVGGEFSTPVILADLPGCARGVFVLTSEVGRIANPAASLVGDPPVSLSEEAKPGD